ncbi:MAG: hypothetical protein LQ352_007392 [Teloschistes flavicans]|nr:MAG: hypothetical protein LQ352_007392 [Teloschistes flavicans]
MPKAMPKTPGNPVFLYKTPPNTGAASSPILMNPKICKLGRKHDSLSNTKARPMVHTTAALVPWRTRAMVRTATDLPRNSINVAPSSATSPIRKGAWRVETRSAMMPAGGEKRTEAPA